MRPTPKNKRQIKEHDRKLHQVDGLRKLLAKKDTAKLRKLEPCATEKEEHCLNKKNLE